MKCLPALLVAGLGVTGCSHSAATPRRPAAAAAVNLSVRTVRVSPGELILEVHIYPHKPLGAAHLTVAGEGIRVAPPAFDFHDLEPPEAPDNSHSPPNPPPLPRTIIRVFHVTATTNGTHGLKVKLQWHKGGASVAVPWPQ